MLTTVNPELQGQVRQLNYAITSGFLKICSVLDDQNLPENSRIYTLAKKFLGIKDAKNLKWRLDGFYKSFSAINISVDWGDNQSDNEIGAAIVQRKSIFNPEFKWFSKGKGEIENDDLYPVIELNKKYFEYLPLVSHYKADMSRVFAKTEHIPFLEEGRSKLSLLIHELSHLLCATDDLAYDLTTCSKLGEGSCNAENWAYFFELYLCEA